MFDLSSGCRQTMSAILDFGSTKRTRLKSSPCGDFWRFTRSSRNLLTEHRSLHGSCSTTSKPPGSQLSGRRRKASMAECTGQPGTSVVGRNWIEAFEQKEDGRPGCTPTRPRNSALTDGGSIQHPAYIRNGREAISTQNRGRYGSLSNTNFSKPC